MRRRALLGMALLLAGVLPAQASAPETAPMAPVRPEVPVIAPPPVLAASPEQIICEDPG